MLRSTYAGAVSCFAGLLLILSLPFAGKFRSPGTTLPGGMAQEWYFCAFFTSALALFSLVALINVRRQNLNKRLWFYISFSIALGCGGLLLNIWQEQQQYDYWSHRGMPYFLPLK